MAIGVGLIVSGKFAREELVLALNKAEHFEVKAVLSDSKPLVNEDGIGDQLNACYESVEELEDSLQALRDEDDIEAFILALPVQMQTTVISRILHAGKHVLSLSPIAKDVPHAERLLKWHHEQHGGKPQWFVGEVFRFKEPIMFAHRQIKALGGNTETFNVKIHTAVAKDGILESSWGRNRRNQGAFILDIGVHYVATLRFLLSATNESIKQVAAFTSFDPGPSPRGTISASMQLTNGNNGTFAFSSETQHGKTFEIYIITDKGTVTLTDRGVVVTKKGPEEDKEQTLVKGNFPSSEYSVHRMVEVFGEGLSREQVEKRGVPQHALEDLKVMQAVLESGGNDGAVVEIH